MKLEGIHHVSSVTGDAQANVNYYSGKLGLRMVKKTVNQDDPTVYHLFYGDDQGSPGFDLTFFEYPGAAGGRAGQGMIHRIVLRVPSEEALDFWERRLGNGTRGRGSLARLRKGRTRPRSSIGSGSSRCTSVSRAACSSRSRLWALASRLTKMPRTWARSWCCRQSSSTCEHSWSRR